MWAVAAAGIWGGERAEGVGEGVVYEHNARAPSNFGLYPFRRTAPSQEGLEHFQLVGPNRVTCISLLRSIADQ